MAALVNIQIFFCRFFYNFSAGMFLIVGIKEIVAKCVQKKYGESSDVYSF